MSSSTETRKKPTSSGSDRQTASPHYVPGTPAAANPALLGYLSMIVGSVALVLYLTDFRSAGNSLAAAIPVMIFSASLFSLIACVWSLIRSEGPEGVMFGLFGTFWLSFSILTVGLDNEWYGQLSNMDQRNAHASFVMTWLLVMVMFTLTTLRMPKAVTLLLVAIDAVFLAMLASILAAAANPEAGDPIYLTIGNIGMTGFIILGVYLFASAMNAATGGKPFPMGKPFLRRR
jgi:succinate-acetate transporter protein